MTPKTQAAKVKVGKWDNRNFKKFCIEENSQQSEKTTYIMGENVCKSYI
jgi:hypothetical protein